MFHSVEINGYRGLRHLTMDGLGRVNLLVGTNNSGKTSALESLYLLASQGDPVALRYILDHRGERLEEVRSGGVPDPELDISHLFFGHDIFVGAQFFVCAKKESSTSEITFSVSEHFDDAGIRDLPLEGEGESSSFSRLSVSISGNPPPIAPSLILTARGGLSVNFLRNRVPRGSRSSIIFPQYVSTRSLSPEQLQANWNSIVLSPLEEQVLDAIRIIEKRIERMAAIATPRYLMPEQRGGFVVKLSGTDIPVPIGSLGDGTWRMLALATALVRAKGGILLVDEIDTGLHYTVMAKMWTMLAKTAKELDVQVFATTHSHDCVASLAAICRDDVDRDSEVTIQRLEPDRETSIPYSEAEIRIAAERNIEVR